MDGHSSATNDPLASQRAELLGRTVAAQFELEAALAASRATGSAMLEARSQIGALAELQRRIASAGPGDLPMLRHEAIATIAAMQTAAREVHNASQAHERAESVELAQHAAAAREQVTALVRDLHRFDPYLRFASPEDEEAYRRREATNLAYIAAEQAKGTPQGDLNASGGAIGQMLDAKAHGAGDSPEFQQRWTELVATTEKLRDAVRRSGGSTAEFDARLREDLRRILRAKGLTDAEIDAQFAAHPDPLEAVKAYVSGGDDLTQLQDAARRANVEKSPIAASAGPAAFGDMASVITALQATDVRLDDCASVDRFAHGLPEQERSAPPLALS